MPLGRSPVGNSSVGSLLLEQRVFGARQHVEQGERAIRRDERITWLQGTHIDVAGLRSQCADCAILRCAVYERVEAEQPNRVAVGDRVDRREGGARAAR